MNKKILILAVMALLVSSFLPWTVHSLRLQKTTALFLITQNGKSGFIDKTGKVVISPQFRSATTFSEGLAPVMFGEGKDEANWKWGSLIKPGSSLSSRSSRRRTASKTAWQEYLTS